MWASDRSEPTTAPTATGIGSQADQDCDAIFGEFLDHFPCFGMRGDNDAQDLADAYGDTLEAYERDFGTPPDGTWISADAASCKRTNCKPQKCK
jgi:hypothetical protein